MLTQSSFTSGGQRGAVLFFAIVVLVATTLAGIALTRSVDTGNIIAGNLAFQQAAVNGADAGIERAIAWLEANNRTLSTVAACPSDQEILWCDILANGYGAAFQDPAASQNWDAFWKNTLVPANQALSLAADSAGNTVSYTIQRLCGLKASPDVLVFGGGGNPCARPPVDEAGGRSKGGSPSVKVKVLSQVYYRITVRIDGPRNTLSYVQALVAL